MMMLPPVGPGARTERRSRKRRASDRPDDPVARAPDVESASAVDPDPAAARRPPRRVGRRASDRSQDAQGEPETAARAPRPFAPLVAQIIANVMGVEQTRSRRRATLAEAEALYAKKRERPKRTRGEA